MNKIKENVERRRRSQTTEVLTQLNSCFVVCHSVNLQKRIGHTPKQHFVSCVSQKVTIFLTVVLVLAFFVHVVSKKCFPSVLNPLLFFFRSCDDASDFTVGLFLTCSFTCCYVSVFASVTLCCSH